MALLPEGRMATEDRNMSKASHELGVFLHLAQASFRRRAATQAATAVLGRGALGRFDRTGEFFYLVLVALHHFRTGYVCSHCHSS